MATSGKVKFTRFNGVSHYDVNEACIASIEHSENPKHFSFQVDGLTVVEEPDAGMIYGGPVLELYFFHGPGIGWDTLVPGFAINVPKGYDESRGDHVASCTFEATEELDHNNIKLLQVEPGRVLINWTATTHDPMFYDHSKPKAILECETWMSVKRDG